MKFIGGYVFRAMCSLLVGLLLVINAEKMPSILVSVIGVLFLIPGCSGVLMYLWSRLNPNAVIKTGFPIVSIGSILFGAYLLAFPQEFANYLIILMGVIITLAGLSQLGNMYVNRRVTPLSWILMIMPFVLIGIGVYSLMHAQEAAKITFQIIGGTLIYYGLTDMFLALRARHYSRIYTRQQEEKEKAERLAREAEYVEFEVVDTTGNE